MRLGNSILAASLLLVSSCASTDLGTREVGERPTDKSTAEAGFWYQMDEAEKSLKSSGRVERDPALQEYVKTITCNVAKDYCDDLRVYIIRAPSFNASMAPNGMMLVHTGLLLRAENESQIAAVLAHEFVHYEENHLLERHAALKNANRGMLILGATGVGGLIPALIMAEGLSGFSQEHETEADVKGQKFLAEAGYDAASAAELWENLSAEFSASGDRFKNKRSRDNGWFASHPDIPDRVTNLKQGAEAYETVAVNPSEYRAFIRPFMEDWLTEEIVKQDPGSTLQLIARLSELGEDKGLLEYAKGRVLKLRGDDGDEAAALAAFKSSVAANDTPALAHRYLGEHYKSAGDKDAAITSFRAYLSAAPDARDVALVSKIITDLGS